jgi:hypothetical protein
MKEQPDKFHGIGGSYILDPETGQRRLADPSENEQPNPQPEQPDECHGVGGSYTIDPETGKPRPHTGREHLLIKPARPPAETKPEPEPEKPAQQITQPARKKNKRGDK